MLSFRYHWCQVSLETWSSQPSHQQCHEKPVAPTSQALRGPSTTGNCHTTDLKWICATRHAPWFLLQLWLLRSQIISSQSETSVEVWMPQLPYRTEQCQCQGPSNDIHVFAWNCRALALEEKTVLKVIPCDLAHLAYFQIQPGQSAVRCYHSTYQWSDLALATPGYIIFADKSLDYASWLDLYALHKKRLRITKISR